MATADDKSSSGWVLLSDAPGILVAHYRSPALGQQLLLEALAKGTVRWRCELLKGWKRPYDPAGGDAAFWCRDDEIIFVNWRECWARRGGFPRYIAYRIEVLREDVMKLLPATSAAKSNNKRRLKVDLVRDVVRELPADFAALSKVQAIKIIGDELARRKIRASDDTILRAIGRR